VGAGDGEGDHRAVGPYVPEQLCAQIELQGCRHVAANLPHPHLALLSGCADPSQQQRSKKCVWHFTWGWERCKKRT